MINTSKRLFKLLRIVAHIWIVNTRKPLFTNHLLWLWYMVSEDEFEKGADLNWFFEKKRKRKSSTNFFLLDFINIDILYKILTVFVVFFFWVFLEMKWEIKWISSYLYENTPISLYPPPPPQALMFDLKSTEKNIYPCNQVLYSVCYWLFYRNSIVHVLVGWRKTYYLREGGGVMVLNITFNNISVILWHQFYWWRKPEYLEKTTELPQVIIWISNIQIFHDIVIHFCTHISTAVFIQTCTCIFIYIIQRENYIGFNMEQLSLVPEVLFKPYILIITV